MKKKIIISICGVLLIMALSACSSNEPKEKVGLISYRTENYVTSTLFSQSGLNERDYEAVQLYPSFDVYEDGEAMINEGCSKLIYNVYEDTYTAVEAFANDHPDVSVYLTSADDMTFVDSWVRDDLDTVE